MKIVYIYLFGYVLLVGLLLIVSMGVWVVDNNLYFYGNLLSKFCMLVVDGVNLVEIYFFIVSNWDLIVVGQFVYLLVVFKLKDCKGLVGYNVKVMLSGIEDSGQLGFLVVDDIFIVQGVGIGMEMFDGKWVDINNIIGVIFVFINGNNDINFWVWIQVKSGCDVMIGEFIVSLIVIFEYI